MKIGDLNLNHVCPLNTCIMWGNYLIFLDYVLGLGKFNKRYIKSLETLLFYDYMGIGL